MDSIRRIMIHLKMYLNIRVIIKCHHKSIVLSNHKILLTIMKSLSNNNTVCPSKAHKECLKIIPFKCRNKSRPDFRNQFNKANKKLL